MQTSEQMTRHTPESIQADLIAILEDIVADWDSSDDAPIGSQTRVIEDLGFESIDVVQFIAAIEDHYRRNDFPVEELIMHDGRYVDEFTVDDVVQFLSRHLVK